MSVFPGKKSSDVLILKTVLEALLWCHLKSCESSSGLYLFMSSPPGLYYWLRIRTCPRDTFSPILAGTLVCKSCHMQADVRLKCISPWETQGASVSSG